MKSTSKKSTAKKVTPKKVEKTLEVGTPVENFIVKNEVDEKEVVEVKVQDVVKSRLASRYTYLPNLRKLTSKEVNFISSLSAHNYTESDLEITVELYNDIIKGKAEPCMTCQRAMEQIIVKLHLIKKYQE